MKLTISTALAVASIAALVVAVSAAVEWAPDWATLWLITAIYTRHEAERLRAEWREERHSEPTP